MKPSGQATILRGAEILNLQDRYVVPVSALNDFVRALRRRLPLARKVLNICFVDDRAIRHLNLAYRGKDSATDVLSFPWNPPGLAAAPLYPGQRGLANFLGDVVISVEAARRNAAAEGHSTLHEIRWLILHGVLHLLGYDHEVDHGEMLTLELALRKQLGIEGGAGRVGPVTRLRTGAKARKARPSRP